MTPLISVLVPAHNDGAYLDTALSSVARQTLASFEAIVADDASDDDTPEIAGRWAERDSRFRLSRVERNLGMNPNWNRALREAEGELILKLDADDAMTPRCLERLAAEFAATPGLLLAACRTLDCDENLEVLGPFLGDQGLRLHGLDPECRHLLPGLTWLRMCFDDIQLWHSNALMFRRVDLLGLGGWDERWFSSDTDLILRALSLDRLVAHVPEPGILYRRRAGSGSDLQRRADTLALPLAMISLRALAATSDSLRPWNRSLRQNWWRLWRLFRERSRRGALARYADAERSMMERLVAETTRLAPPAHVRVEGWLRWRAWQARRTFGLASDRNGAGA